MLKRFLAVLVFAALSSGCATNAKGREVPRIDATSTTSAEQSYSRMMDDLSAAKKQRLALAVLLINLDGFKSVYEDLNNTEPRSISRIKDKVAGLSAEEIISLGSRSSARAEPAGQ